MRGGRAALLVWGALVLAACGGPPDAVELVLTQEPAGMRKGPRAPAGSRVVALRESGELQVLSEGFFAASDPCVSFDGRRVLFAGQRRAGGDWAIWEMDLEGKKLRRLTRGRGHCTEPFYLPRASITPPEFDDRVRWFGFVGDAQGVPDPRRGDRATALYAASLEPLAGRGRVLWRTTFNLSSDFSPTLLGDGRVLFSSHRGTRTPLMCVNWAGTGLNPFYEEHRPGLERVAACEVPGGDVVFVEAQDAGSGGALARVRLRRPLGTYEPLSRGAGLYRTPGIDAGGKLLVAWRAEGESYGLYEFDFETGGPGAKVYDDPAWDEVDPQAAAPRPEARARIPIVDESRDTGLLYCLNVYDSDRPGAAKIAPGAVRRVRFVEGVAGAAGPAARVLGEAPVEKDGSFYTEVPADTPLLLQTLDDRGRVLQSMEGWIWVRRGSRRGCIGCHEERELTPENRLVEALRRGTPHSRWRPVQERPPFDLSALSGREGEYDP